MQTIQKLSFILLLAICIIMPTAVEAKQTVATPQMTTILLNDDSISAATYNIDGYNYFQLRELAQILSDTSSQFNIDWDQKNKIIQIVPKEQYLFESPTYYDEKFNPYQISYNTTKLSVNGKTHTMKAYLINGYTYFQLRELSSILNFELGYDAKSRNVSIKTAPIPGVYPIKTIDNFAYNIKTSSHPRWANKINDFIIANNDGTISLVEHDITKVDMVEVGENVVITTYDKNYEKLSEKKLPLELPIFGTFFSGEKYNYIAYGDKGSLKNNKEVIRIVKYDKHFNRISAASIYGDDLYTLIPFEASSGGRMVEYGNSLIYHTSRLRYDQHQSQLTIELDTNTMQVTNKLGEFQWNHVSHSFDQYVLIDNGTPVYLDHGDAYPRGLVLNKKGNYNPAMEDYKANEFSFFNISGSTGANVTGVSIGGFEQSDSHYLVAFDSINQQNNYSYTSYELIGGDVDKRNIYLYAIEKNYSENNQKVNRTTIANYEDSNLYASTPTLVKLTNNQFIFLWQEYSEKMVVDSFVYIEDKWLPDFSTNGVVGNLKYVYVDGQGNITTPVTTLPNYFRLSTVQPIVKDNKIIWFVKELKNFKPKQTIYEINLNNS